ncbi:MAG: hypothetical protein CSB33_00595 [Desulfobacterales bacterium]|nr:MAG: hypothetical protein CSB33_00595 [Desulfobacterales bacterium]
MSDTETLLINADIEITPAALRAIVENAKTRAGRDEKGHYRVDTYKITGQVISRFLSEYNFEAFARRPDSLPAEPRRI